MEIIGKLMFNMLISVIVTFVILGVFAVLAHSGWFQDAVGTLMSAAGLL